MNTDPLRVRPFRLHAREPLIVLGIIALASGACMRELPKVRHKIGLLEPLIHATEGRGAVLEHLALTGRLETHDSMPALATPNDRSAVHFRRQAGGGIVVERDPAPGRAAFGLSLNPAVADDGIDAVVVWLCGQRRPPAGWLGPAQPVVRNLAVEQLPATCRGTTD